MALQQKVFASEHPKTLYSMDTLGAHLTFLGQHEAAADLAQRALSMRERMLGLEHPATVRSMRILSLRLATLGQTQAALALVRQALAAKQAVQDQDACAPAS